MTILNLILLLLFQTEGATVEGIVMKPGGAEPLGGARVTIASTLDNQKQFSANTEEDGRFTLGNIPPGDYTLTANSPRYGTAAFGQKRAGGPRSTLSLSTGQKLTDIKVSMMATGTIAGRITSRNGQALVRVAVQAFQYTYRDGKKILSVVQSTTTNDLGEYRLFWLPQGPYLVAVTNGEISRAVSIGIHPPGMITVGTNNGLMTFPDFAFDAFFLDSSLPGSVIRRMLDDGTTQEESWMPVYYPGTTEARDATTINVAAGATMNGVNIAFAPAPVRKISGTVVGAQGLGGNVYLIPKPTSAGGQLNTGASPSFEFKGVKPGSYIVYAMDRSTGNVSNQMAIEVGDRNMENLVLTVRPGIVVTGKVIVGNSTDRNVLSGISIGLNQGNVELPAATLAPGLLGLDGDAASATFVALNVSPGNYQPQINSLRPQDSGTRPFYVKSVRLGGTDVTNSIPVTDAMPQDLEFIISNEYGAVEGHVVEPGRPAAAGATVVLVPAIARSNSSLYKAVVADAAGRFRFPVVNAGDYRIFAWNDIETGVWESPDFMRPYESKGLPVHVSGNGKSDVQVTAIPAP